MLSRCSVTVCILGVVCTGGCVTYDDVVFEVVNDHTREPIPDAYLSLQWQGVMLRLNAGKLEGVQRGYTDSDGQWECRTPTNLYGNMFVGKEGYADQSISIDPGMLDDGGMKIALQRE